MEKKSISNYATCLTVNCYNIPIKQQKKKLRRTLALPLCNFFLKILFNAQNDTKNNLEVKQIREEKMNFIYKWYDLYLESLRKSIEKQVLKIRELSKWLMIKNH